MEATWRRFCLDEPGGFVPRGSPQIHPFPAFIKEGLGELLPNPWLKRADSLLFEPEEVVRRQAASGVQESEGRGGSVPPHHNNPNPQNSSLRLAAR
jgi:hypothetical protein